MSRGNHGGVASSQRPSVVLFWLLTEYVELLADVSLSVLPARASTDRSCGDGRGTCGVGRWVGDVHGTLLGPEATRRRVTEA
jgi:hypothetical protein